jgi:hypothetical protein
MSIMHTRTALFLVLLILLAVPVLAAVPPGRISVFSSPSGAMACLDSGSCDITSTTFTVEGNTWHKVTVTAKGYQPWSQNVYVTSDQTSMVEAYLDRDPNTTAVRITITPGGGIICLDNSDCRANVGANSTSGSTLFTGVSEGYHTVSVEAPVDYEDTTRLVKVELGKITEVDIVLTMFIAPATTTPAAPRATGSIRVYVDRTGSTVCINNGDCYVNVGGSPGPGTGTVVFSDVTAGEVQIITIAADGYMPVSTAITVGKDQIATADVSLRPVGGATTVTTLTTVPQSTLPPTMPTARSGLDVVPVLGALTLCSAVFLFRKY